MSRQHVLGGIAAAIGAVREITWKGPIHRRMQRPPTGAGRAGRVRRWVDTEGYQQNGPGPCARQHKTFITNCIKRRALQGPSILIISRTNKSGNNATSQKARRLYNRYKPWQFPADAPGWRMWASLGPNPIPRARKQWKCDANLTSYVSGSARDSH